MVSRKIQFLVLHLVVGLAMTQKINYKDVGQFEEIWADHGSKGDEDVSIWRLTHLANGYCALGDVAKGSYGHPDFRSISVEMGAHVKHPDSFTQIWNDKGSGADLDCAVYRMNGPSGYTCIGAVAMQSHTAHPDRTKYCCIEDFYLTEAYVERIYRDIGTGADKDLSLWKVYKRWSNSPEGNNFLAVKDYNKPSNAKLLKGSTSHKVVS